MSELSSLVKTAKRLLETQRINDPAEDINDIVDEMILRAFKIVTKGVRFLDLWEDDKRSTEAAADPEGTPLPPSPTPDAAVPCDATPRAQRVEVPSRSTGSVVETESLPSQSSEGTQTNWSTTNKRISSAYASTGPSSYRASQMLQPHHLNRPESTISHRVSLAGASALSGSRRLVSERLAFCQDAFLSQLASLIGRLHLQSHSRLHLAMAVKECALSGGDLLVVADGVAAHNALGHDIIRHSRKLTSDRTRDLVDAARHILNSPSTEFGEVIVMPDDNNRLLGAATDCVVVAGECVHQVRAVLERVGDFEMDFENAVPCTEWNFDLLDGIQDERDQRRPSVVSVVASTSESSISEATTTTTQSSQTKSSSVPAPIGRSHTLSVDKPLPEVPKSSVSSDEPQLDINKATISQPQAPKDEASDAPVTLPSPPSSMRPLLPPLPKLSTSMLPPQEQYSPTEQSDGNEGEFPSSSFSSRTESLTASSMDSNKTYLSRISQGSIMSQTSTRATTPEVSCVAEEQATSSITSTATSTQTTTTDDGEDLESKLLQKTFAHELLFNKEGQVTGGSLPALVERLTTHESTPDAMFVSTFYLTFRQFCTSTMLVECLVDRFDYVGDSPYMASPVRLRVYNVFKGWMESHWRDDVDKEALPAIQQFAETKLAAVLPSAAKRLLELTQRVLSQDGTLVPRLLSSMGKTSTSISQYVPADAPLPAPALSKSQTSLLNNWKSGGTCPSILDFDPLEVARQLTVRQMTVFCSIMPEELLGSQWMKDHGANAPNVKAMSSFSTELSNLVADSILQYSEVKKRALAIKQWIKIADRCLELNNYDALMAIICSLNSSTITRLRKTWDMVSPKRRQMHKHLQSIVEPNQNHKVLRARLQGHVPPCLPFLGMFLTDLTFVDIGNPPTKTSDTGLTLINFDKHTRTAKIIGELQRFQIPYRLTEVPDLQDWIKHQIEHVREVEAQQQGSSMQVNYYRKSLLLEPRETQALKSSVDAPVPTPGTGNSMFGWMRSTSSTSTNTTNTVSTTASGQVTVPAQG